MKAVKTVTVYLDQDDVVAAIREYLENKYQFNSNAADFSTAEVTCTQSWNFTVTAND